MTATEELDKLKKLHEDGTITDEQYERAKANLHDEKEAEEEDAGADHAEPDREKREEERDRDERAAPAEERNRDERGEREERRPRRHRERDEEDDDDRRLSPNARRKQVREWCMVLHLSLLAGHAVALGGIIAPIVIWQIKKDEYPEIDAHGKNVVNWLITWTLFMLVSLVLAFVVIGIPMLIIGGVLGIVFPIIGGVKANEGQVWRYPLAIPFLR